MTDAIVRRNAWWRAPKTECAMSFTSCNRAGLLPLCPLRGRTGRGQCHDHLYAFQSLGPSRCRDGCRGLRDSRMFVLVIAFDRARDDNHRTDDPDAGRLEDRGDRSVRRTDDPRFRRVGCVVADRSRALPRKCAATSGGPVVQRGRPRTVGLPLQHRGRRERCDGSRPRTEAVSRRRRGPHVLEVCERRGRAAVDRFREQCAAAVHDERSSVRWESQAGDGRRVRAIRRGHREVGPRQGQHHPAVRQPDERARRLVRRLRTGRHAGSGRGSAPRWCRRWVGRSHSRRRTRG